MGSKEPILWDFWGKYQPLVKFHFWESEISQEAGILPENPPEIGWRWQSGDSLQWAARKILKIF